MIIGLLRAKASEVTIRYLCCGQHGVLCENKWRRYVALFE